MLNSGLKSFYISVSFTRYCSHSYLCKPRNLRVGLFITTYWQEKGPRKKESSFGKKILRLLNSANGNDIVINIIEVNERASELKKITRKGKKLLNVNLQVESSS